MNINMTTARDVQAAAELADINEETLLAECKATKADLESLDRKLKELEALSEPLYPCLISSRRLSFGCSSLGRRNECRTNSRAHAEGITGIGRNMAAERPRARLTRVRNEEKALRGVSDRFRAGKRILAPLDGPGCGSLPRTKCSLIPAGATAPG